MDERPILLVEPDMGGEGLDIPSGQASRICLDAEMSEQGDARTEIHAYLPSGDWIGAGADMCANRFQRQQQAGPSLDTQSAQSRL